MSDDQPARWRDKLADGAKRYEAVFTAVGSVATGFALIGVAISGYAALQQSKSAIQEQREKQPIFQVGAVADDSGRPMKIVVTHEGDVRSGPTMRAYSDILLGNRSTEIERGDVVATVCRCSPTVVIPVSFWGPARPSRIGLVVEPGGFGPPLDEIVTAWQKVVGADAAVELVTHVVIKYDDVQGQSHQAAFAIGKPGDFVEPPGALLQLKGHERLLAASAESPTVAEQCGKPSTGSLLFGPVGQQVSTMTGGFAGRLRNVAGAVLQGPDNATRLITCA